MAAKEPSDYTVAELKDFLRENNLAVVGTKAELIMRLTSFDATIWARLNKERAKEADVIEEEELQDNTSESVNAPSIVNTEEQMHRTRNASTEDELIRRENELLRRERDLLQRELNIARQRRTLSGSTVMTNSSQGEHSMLPMNESVRTVRDLLSEFDGSEGSFWRWEQQLALLRLTYVLDDNATRILISAKLKGRALEWFHSKPSHLILSVENLLKEMKQMFDHRQTKLILRKNLNRESGSQTNRLAIITMIKLYWRIAYLSRKTRSSIMLSKV